ncbi:methionyl-tRNA formyltransferase [Candidatus Paracaedibacter symbiosus]|uniref:methionyl-tRNA formyltransferase n=1 Tax=Candidatus Paracaedibacter symbiosus TaxID=244582 RepID=UPI0005097D6A|nr:methionyl-tRNA formyltransferase [Candidatus Paracaedibacter symbiosus]
MSRLRVVFMATPQFSVATLEKLVEADYDVVAVYCQPPRPSGRGHKLIASPVHQKATSLGIPVFTPKSLRNEIAQAEFKALNADIAVVVAYGLILPKAILETPKFGCLNIHASLLPRWRGAAPMQRAIMAGDTETGITIMQMDEGLDTGPMLVKESLPITSTTTASNLHDAMSLLGAELLLKTLDPYIMGMVKPTIQPETGITYADKLSKLESCLNWAESAQVLDRRVRALNPWPGVYFEHNGTLIKVSKIELIANASGTPGEVIDNQLTIACGEGAIRLLQVQRPGGKWLSPAEFLNGYDLPPGTKL